MPYLKAASDGKVYAVHGMAWPRWVTFGLLQVWAASEC
ncbi:putative tonB-dependent receptor protein [Synechococcus sp. ROS8604]|nr:putative tonB-dependent receptor protein [Synechococcus sp. ROS8604]